MEQQRTALVLGATGGIGGAIASSLHRHGWSVRALARDAARARATAGAALGWIDGDAMRPADVVRAAAGTSVIVHAVNPPGYRDWDRLVLPMIDNSIAAARATGARIVLPGTIYNFDPARTPVLTETSPQQPQSRKGQIRREMEARLEAAAPEVPSLILRAGDFFGPGARASWFAQAMVTPGRPVTRIREIARGPGHSWAYLPDLAETFARLLDAQDKLRPFERLQFEGFHDATGRGMAEAVEAAARRRVRSGRFPWWAMRALAPFGGFPREAAEIAPYWRHPVRLDNRRLEALIGPEPRTPLAEALRATLAFMGSLPVPSDARVAA
ncbi:NAD-dependent epimerase/dehydratase family protein [Paracoccus yeei]|uniref:NAD(P)H-binding protein n=1 Tax=Paracoccus yeei TaxID=147645 RepID=UPI003BF778C0